MQSAVPLACFLSMIRPPGIQFENALLQISPVDKAKCPFVKDHNDIEFQLYTRHNPTVYQELIIDDDEKLFASNLDYHAPTVVYFHAFMETPDDGSAIMVREAYVLRGDTNIIMVDASRLEAGPWYFTAAENTWYIGKFAAQFVDYLVTRGLNLNNTHFVGHSLGAQAAGVAGSALKTGRVSRITGLDPALPLFHGLPMNQRLDKSDAEFVDVIHTDAGIFGVNKPVGHADFYPNGGISPQPGCELEVVIPQQMLLNKFFCSHWRSYMFYTESILRPDSFAATSCASWKHYARGGCANAHTAHMGFGAHATIASQGAHRVPHARDSFTRAAVYLIAAMPTYCDTNAQPRGIYSFHLSPNRITKNSHILQRRLQKFFTQIQTLKSTDKEIKPIKIDNQGQMLKASEDGLETKKVESQESLKPSVGEIRKLHSEVSLETRILDSQDSRKPSVPNTQESLKIRKLDPHVSLGARILNTQENVKPRVLEDRHKIRKLNPQDSHEIIVLHPQESLKPSVGEIRNLYSQESLETSVPNTHESLKIRKLDPHVSLGARILDSEVNHKFRKLHPQDSIESSTLDPEKRLKTRKFDLQDDQKANYDQIMVESVKNYHVLQPDFVNRDQNNFGAMKPIINKNKNEKTNERETESKDKRLDIGVQLATISDLEPFRLDLDRHLIPPRVEKNHRKFQTKEDAMKTTEEVKIGQMPFYNQEITDGSKTQTKFKNVQESYRTRSSEEQSQTDSDSQGQSQVDSDSQEPSQTELDAQEQLQTNSDSLEQQRLVGSHSQEKSQVDSKSQDHSKFDSDSQGHSKIDSDSQGHSKFVSDSQGHSQVDSDSQKHSLTDSDSKKQSQTDSNGSIVHKNHVIKRQKRFLNPFKRSEAEQQENFFFKLLDFVFKNRKGIPVYSVMREINTLVKSAHGELNHISKERNNYIGAPPPTLIPITYTLELGNEGKMMAFIKKLLGLAPKGDRLTINGQGK